MHRMVTPRAIGVAVLVASAACSRRPDSGPRTPVSVAAMTKGSWVIQDEHGSTECTLPCATSVSSNPDEATLQVAQHDEPMKRGEINGEDLARLAGHRLDGRRIDVAVKQVPVYGFLTGMVVGGVAVAVAGAV